MGELVFECFFSILLEISSNIPLIVNTERSVNQYTIRSYMLFRQRAFVYGPVCFHRRAIVNTIENRNKSLNCAIMYVNTSTHCIKT